MREGATGQHSRDQNLASNWRPIRGDKKPAMARLTLARKIAAVTLAVWKQEGGSDAAHLKLQA
jgi:hypothetical protein